MDNRHPYLVASWTDEDLDKIRDDRKYYAALEQKLIADTNETVKTISKDAMIEYRRMMKPIIKDCQSCVKAATILIDCFYGKGRFEHSVPSGAFPAELDLYFTILLAKL